jgi:hypothetical protein
MEDFRDFNGQMGWKQNLAILASHRIIVPVEAAINQNITVTCLKYGHMALMIELAALKDYIIGTFHREKSPEIVCRNISFSLQNHHGDQTFPGVSAAIKRKKENEENQRFSEIQNTGLELSDTGRPIPSILNGITSSFIP